MRFDWYGATVQAFPEAVLGVLRSDLSQVYLREDRRSGRNNYKWADTFLDPFGDEVCALLHGGSNPYPHVQARGEHSPIVSDVLRRAYPGYHRVTRADCAIDFDGPGCWDRLFALLQAFASEMGLKWRTIGDFRLDRDPSSGRTAYVGSRESTVTVRLYEKGLKENQEAGEAVYSSDWCRLEVEVKPPKLEGRLKLAKLSPLELWGCSLWSCKLLSRVNGLDVERTTMSVRKEPDHVRAIKHMLLQYGPALRLLYADLGSDEALGSFIRQELQKSEIAAAA